MTSIKSNNHISLDMGYILTCYLKTLFPTWRGGPEDLQRVMKILEGEIMTHVQTDCGMIKQQCVENPELILFTLILERVTALRTTKTDILKQLQNQI